MHATFCKQNVLPRTFWAIPIYIRIPPVEEQENSMGGGHFFQMENSMEGGIFELEIPRRGLKILTKCWKIHGKGVNSVGNSMGGR